jgi:hypothetical protein
MRELEAREIYVVCHNGVFLLPDEVVKSLSTMVTNGFVYLREDEDMLTISTTRLADGRRRVLQNRYRSPMFRDATKLAIVDLKESIRVMAVEKRVNATGRVRTESPPAAE